MDRVKIKRVKRNKKKITAKEKILAGIGMGGSLLGGIGSVAQQKPKTQAVSTQQQASGISKIKDAIGKFFKGAYEKTAEVPTARAYTPGDDDSVSMYEFELNPDPHNDEVAYGGQWNDPGAAAPGNRPAQMEKWTRPFLLLRVLWELLLV